MGTKGRRERWAAGYREVKERDERWLGRLDLKKVNRILVILLAAFLALNFVDVVSTLTAISKGGSFTELNPIASGLFQLGFYGFVLALVLKYFPVLPLAYGVFVQEPGSVSVQVRTVKLATLGVLGASDIFYLAVAINNLANLTIAQG